MRGNPLRCYWRLLIKYATVGLLLCSVVFFSRCAEKRVSNRVFHYNELTGIASLDPAFAKNQSVIWATGLLYNTLVECDSNLQIRPSLATQWQLDSGGLRYRFLLRNNVYFHHDACFSTGEGRRVVAADVVFSLARLINPATASPGAWVLNERVAEQNPFSAEGDSVVVLRLRAPYPPLLSLLSMSYCSVVPPEAVQHYGADFRKHPVGTGPFQLTRWVEGQALILQRNPRYFERDSQGQSLPYLDGVAISFFDSKITEFLEFQQGRLDFVNDIESSFKDELLTRSGALQPAWQGKLQLYKQPYLNTEYFGINVNLADSNRRGHALALRAVRQALNYGIDRRKLMMYLRNSIGTPAEHGFIPNGMPSYSDSVNPVAGYTYQPQRAAQRLQEAGFPGGKGLPELTLTTIPVYAEIAQFAAAQWREIGIPVRVSVVPKSVLLTETANGTVAFFRGSWIADYPDPENYLSVFYGRMPAPPNYTRFKDARYDSLYNAMQQALEPSKRKMLIAQMEERLLSEAPLIPLWYDQVIHLVQNRVQGWRPNALNRLDLRRVRLLDSNLLQ